MKQTSVFARVSPQHKLRIVQQLMQLGEIVAVTGDGVNDAPALRAAHIGVAMGITGTDVARETASMIITDDNFATIFSAVEEGRAVFANLRRVTLFLLPTGFASLLTIVVSQLLRLPNPYLPLQILWVNLVTSGMQDIALAFEPPEAGIGLQAPRRPTEGMVSPLMWRRGALVGILITMGTILSFLLALREGMPLENARTAAITTLVFFQFFQAWNCRSESLSVLQLSPFGNPALFYALGAAFLAQLALIYVPLMQRVFETAPLTVAEWIRVLPISATVLLAVEADKLVLRRTQRLAS